MSLSSNNRLVNPAQKFIQWKSDKGFFYYDKEQKADVQMPKAFTVVVLDTLATIKGFHEQSMSSIFSNEVHNTKEEPLNVRSFKGGTIVEGLYSDIKGSLDGGKFCNSIYAALVTGSKKSGFSTELVNISLQGAALSAFIEAKIKTDGTMISLSKNPEQQKKGAVKYYIPAFKKSGVDEDVTAECMYLDSELQSYFTEYVKQEPNYTEKVSTTPSNKVIAEAAKAVAVEEAGEEDDLPF